MGWFEDSILFEIEKEKEKPKLIKKSELDNLKEIFKPTKPSKFSNLIIVGSNYQWRTSPISSKFWQSINSFEACRSIVLVGHPFLTNNSVPDYSKIIVKDIIKEKENLRFIVLESYDLNNSVILKILCGSKVHWTVIENKLIDLEIKKLG